MSYVLPSDITEWLSNMAPEGNKECKQLRQQLVAANTGVGKEGSTILKWVLGTAKREHSSLLLGKHAGVASKPSPAPNTFPGDARQWVGRFCAWAFLSIGLLWFCTYSQQWVWSEGAWLASLCTTNSLCWNLMYSEVYKKTKQTPFSSLGVFYKTLKNSVK